MRRRESEPDAGAAAVEFAIVSVLLLTILFGILQYGYFFLQSTAAEHAAREGARLASVGTVSCSGLDTETAKRGGTANVTNTALSFTEASAPPGYSRGDTLVVTVAWTPANFGLPIPFISATSLSEKATTRVEFVDQITGACS